LLLSQRAREQPSGPSPVLEARDLVLLATARDHEADLTRAALFVVSAGTSAARGIGDPICAVFYRKMAAIVAAAFAIGK
jgi:hypothetical protein